jgi:hypothetical protein
MLSRRTVLCAALLTLALCAAAFAAAPKLEFVSESIDLGKVVKGAPITAVFTFKNAGDADLVISNVRPGCGCTTAEAKKTTLAPGESSTIEALLASTSEYNGHISKNVTVTSNDTSRGAVSLLFQAEVVALATTTPERLNFGSVKADSSRTHLLCVFAGDPKTFAITKVVPVGSHVTVPGFRKISVGGREYWEVTVLVKGSKTPGRLLEAIDIVAGPDEKKDKITVQIYGNVVE